MRSSKINTVVGITLRNQFIIELLWDLRERSILMADAIHHRNNNVAIIYWETIKLIGKEISLTLKEIQNEEGL